MKCQYCLIEMDEDFTLNGKTGKRCPICGKIDWDSLKEEEGGEETGRDTEG